MVIRIRKITNCIALPIFILTMPRLCEEHRNMAIGMLINGASINVVAQQFNVHRNTISRLQTRFHHSGTVCDRNRSGRPRVTTPVQDRYIHLLHLRNRFRNAELTSTDLPPQISPDKNFNFSSQEFWEAHRNFAKAEV